MQGMTSMTTPTRAKKVTIYLDDSITPELLAWLTENGDSQGGRKLLRMGYLLEQSSLADQIQLLAKQKGMATASQFDLVAKAVELLAPLQHQAPLVESKVDSNLTTAEPEEAMNTPKSSVFAAGRSN